MRYLLTSFLAVCVVASAQLAAAAERVDVCAKEGQGGKAYRVQATVLSGAELVQATASFRYNTFAKYVVIFWAQNQASIIELDFPVLSAVDVPGRDQQGRRWEVSTNIYCF